jgi:protein-disulfide isomerase
MTFFRRFATIELQSMKNTVCILTVAVLLTASAVAQTKHAHKLATKPSGVSSERSAKTELPSEETVNSFLYQTFGYDPTITWKISEIRPSEMPGLAEITVILSNTQGSSVSKLYVSSDGKHAITGEVLPFGARPFDPARAKLEKGMNGPAKGPAHALVTVVEFSDLQCPHCKEAEPNIEQLLALEPEIHFVYQNFPLPSHDWAEKAAGYVDCVAHASNDAVWKFIKETFGEQSNITAANADEKLKAIATGSGVNGDQMAACAAKPGTVVRVEQSIALGKSVGVTGTPTIFINGRPMGGATPVDILRKVVEFQANQAKEGKPEASGK